jgi:hypothetical protein
MWSLRTIKVAPVLAIVAGLALAGCVPGYFEEGNATRVLLLTAINGGSPLSSDVTISSGAVCPDIVPVRVENHAKNPNAPVAGFRDDIVIERYEVRYYRSDGRGTEGVDVPYRISGNIAFEILGAEATNVPIEVVRRQAKIEAPIWNHLGGGGGRITTMFAEITLHARTTTGVATNTASGRLQIDFADYADDDTTCPVAETT